MIPDGPMLERSCLCPRCGRDFPGSMKGHGCPDCGEEIVPDDGSRWFRIGEVVG